MQIAVFPNAVFRILGTAFSSNAQFELGVPRGTPAKVENARQRGKCARWAYRPPNETI